MCLSESFSRNVNKVRELSEKVFSSSESMKEIENIVFVLFFVGWVGGFLLKTLLKIEDGECG